MAIGHAQEATGLRCDGELAIVIASTKA